METTSSFLCTLLFIPYFDKPNPLMMYDMNWIYMYERLGLLDLVDIYEESFIIVGLFYI